MNSKKLLTTKEAAQKLKVSENTLTVWRCTKKVEIPYCELGSAIRYRESDLEEFINKNLKGV